MSQIPELSNCMKCGRPMERKCFMGGFPPIWRCKPCEYKEQDEARARWNTRQTQGGESK